MATLGGTALTLLDVLKMQDPDGKAAQTVELLNQRNGMLDDITWIECNDGESHQTTLRTGLPSGTWRRYNEGVQPSKGTQAQVRVQTGMLEANSIIDRALAEKGNRVKETRANEAAAHMEGLGQQMAAAMFYEDERTNIARITGIQAHYGTVNTATAASAENVVDAGGTGSDNLSIYKITFGPNAITGVFPQGSRAGLVHEDKGLVSVADATGITGATYDAYKDWFQWKAGLAVRDWRKAGRIANVDVSNLRAEVSNADLIKKMILLDETVIDGGGNTAWYMNKTAMAWFRIQALAKASSQITLETLAGVPLIMFAGRPCRRVDVLLNTEARVV